MREPQRIVLDPVGPGVGIERLQVGVKAGGGVGSAAGGNARGGGSSDGGMGLTGSSESGQARGVIGMSALAAAFGPRSPSNLSPDAETAAMAAGWRSDFGGSAGPARGEVASNGAALGTTATAKGFAGLGEGLVAGVTQFAKGLVGVPAGSGGNGGGGNGGGGSGGGETTAATAASATTNGGQSTGNDCQQSGTCEVGNRRR